MRALLDETRFDHARLHGHRQVTDLYLLALAVADGRLGADQAFEMSRIDNRWQAEQWGEDAEEAEAEALRRAAFLQADRFYRLCG